MNIQLFETSAKHNINVDEMFRGMTELVLRSKLEQQHRLGTQTDLHKHESGIKLTGSQRPGSHKPSKTKNSCCKWRSFLMWPRCCDKHWLHSTLKLTLKYNIYSCEQAKFPLFWKSLKRNILKSVKGVHFSLGYYFLNLYYYLR